MRKSSAIVMGIIVVAFGGLMMAANVALKPLERYANIAAEVTSILANLELIEPRSKVFVLGVKGGEKRLAPSGFGLLVEFAPAASVRSTPGRLERVAYRAIEEVRGLHGRGTGPDAEWYEIKLLLPGGGLHRSLVRTDEALRLARAEPAFPQTLAP